MIATWPTRRGGFLDDTFFEKRRRCCCPGSDTPPIPPDNPPPDVTSGCTTVPLPFAVAGRWLITGGASASPGVCDDDISGHGVWVWRTGIGPSGQNGYVMDAGEVCDRALLFHIYCDPAFLTDPDIRGWFIEDYWGVHLIESPFWSASPTQNNGPPWSYAHEIHQIYHPRIGGIIYVYGGE